MGTNKCKQKGIMTGNHGLHTADSVGEGSQKSTLMIGNRLGNDTKLLL